MNDKAKSILRVGKVERKVKDPVRFPKIINTYEKIAKSMYAVSLNKTQIEISKFISEIANEK